MRFHNIYTRWGRSFLSHVQVVFVEGSSSRIGHVTKIIICNNNNNTRALELLRMSNVYVNTNWFEV